MRAAFYERQGAPEDVLQIGMLERPQPGPGEVLVKVHASGVNPSDTYGRSGRTAPMAFARVIPHQDGAGIIAAVGADVPTQRVGERVWIYEATWNRPGGTAADFSVVPAQRAVKLPDNTDFDAGACLGIPAMTVAPPHLASWIAALPTAPAPPVTRMVWPSTGPSAKTARCAVSAGMPRQAPASKSVLSGSFTAR